MVAPNKARADSGSFSSDVELTTAASRGDERAQALLVDRLVNRVRKTASYMARPPSEADDYAQIALVEILKSAGSYRGDSSLEHWADRITVRVISQHHRKNTRRKGLFERFHTREQPVVNPDDTLDLQTIRSCMAHHLDALSLERRTALVLHHVLGFSVAEIAESTATPVNTVRDRLRVGRKQLRTRMLKDPALREYAQKGGL